MALGYTLSCPTRSSRFSYSDLTLPQLKNVDKHLPSFVNIFPAQSYSNSRLVILLSVCGGVLFVFPNAQVLQQGNGAWGVSAGCDAFTALHIEAEEFCLCCHSVQLMVFIPVSSILCLWSIPQGCKNRSCYSELAVSRCYFFRLCFFFWFERENQKNLALQFFLFVSSSSWLW